MREYNNTEKIFKQYYNQTGRLWEIDDIRKNRTISHKYISAPFTMDMSLMMDHLEQESRQFELCEEIFLTAESDVALIKHPRYCPIRSHVHTFFELVYILEGSCQ